MILRFNILVLGLIALLGVCAIAAPVSGEIEAIDTKKRQITVSHGGFTTFNYRPSVTVTFNGQPSSIQQLDVGHSVVITSNETGIASEIAATAPKPKSKPSTAPSPAPYTIAAKPNKPAANQTLGEKLAGTVWSWPNPNEKKKLAWFRLNPDGTTNAGWHKELRSWRILSEDTAEVIAMHNRTPQILHFNATATEATLDGQPHVIYKRISPKP